MSHNSSWKRLAEIQNQDYLFLKCCSIVGSVHFGIFLKIFSPKWLLLCMACISLSKHDLTNPQKQPQLTCMTSKGWVNVVNMETDLVSLTGESCETGFNFSNVYSSFIHLTGMLVWIAQLAHCFIYHIATTLRLP